MGGYVGPGGQWREVADQPAGGLYGQMAALVSGGGILGGSVFRIYYLGDSHKNNPFYTDGASHDGLSPPSYFSAEAPNSNYRGWGSPPWVHALSMGQVRCVGSKARQTNGLLTAGTNPVGVPGSVQVAQMLADPAYALANVVGIGFGFNDPAFSIAAESAALDAVLAQITGRLILLYPSPPRSDAAATTVGGDGMQAHAWYVRWNEELKRKADASNGRIQYVDSYGEFNNPTATPDSWRPGWSYDNIHGTNATGYVEGRAVVNKLFPGGVGTTFDLWRTSSWSRAAGANGLVDQGFCNPTFAAATATFTASASGTTLTVTAVGAGSILTRAVAQAALAGSEGMGLCGLGVFGGNGIPAGTFIVSQSSGSAGSTGTYVLSQAVTGTVPSSTMYGVVGLSIVTRGSSGASFTLTQAACDIPGGAGNMLTLSITCSAAGDGIDMLSTSVHGGTFITNGDSAWAEYLMRANSGGIYPRNVHARLTAYNGSNFIRQWCEEDATKEIALPMSGSPVLLASSRDNPFRMPAGAAALSDLALRGRATSGGAGTMSISVSNAAVRRVKAS